MAYSHPESFVDNLSDDTEAMENPVGAVVEEVPAVPTPRRDENSISFRHFLQQQTDVVASRHHNPRGGNAGAVDLVDITIALPDFVQDHLVLEAQATDSSHNSDAPLDLSVLHQVLPEFASSQRNSVGRRVEEESRNTFENGGCYPCTSNPQSQSTTLPDFLSDGPMYCTSNNETTNSNTNHSSFAISPCIKSGSPENRSEMNQRSQSVDTDSQTQVERLRRELMEKTRSITQLQHEVARQRSEIHGLREALTAAERRVPATHNDMASGDQPGNRCGSILNPQSSTVLPTVPVNGSVANDRDHAHSTRVLQVVETSESLIRKLMHQINALKNVAADIENQEKDKDK